MSPVHAVLIVSCVLLPAGTGCVSTWPAYVEASLSKVGRNRPELERVLRHYQRDGDPQKLEAARFLTANMDGHGYTVTALYDSPKNEIEFDALDYPNLNEARARLDALEKEHGEVNFKRKRLDPDLETITASAIRSHKRGAQSPALYLCVSKLELGPPRFPPPSSETVQ